jgi:glycosyltransferase involved in cell wall biosynthesis
VGSAHPRDALNAMRILHIGKYFPPVAGGMERFLGDLVTAQRAAGDEVSVLVHAEERTPADDPPWLMRCPVWTRLVFAPISPAFPFWLSRAIKRYRPDVVHIHMPNLSALWALLLPSARSLPWVVHWQSDVEPSKFRRSLRLAYPHYRVFERALLERADAIVAHTPRYLETSNALQPWRLKCQVIPLGVDPKRMPDVPEGAGEGYWQGRGMRVLSIGRLAYYKGFETLIRAVARARGMELVVVGKGEERAHLEKVLAEEGSPPWITLMGEADDATCQKLLASCDVFCLASRERTEAFGIVLVEAMRYARPLVVSDLRDSGVTWVARAGQNAVVVPPEDVAAWTGALEEIGAHPTQRNVMGRLGHERYLREFDIAGIAGRIRGLYDLVIRARAEDRMAQMLEDIPEPESNGDADKASGPPPVHRLLVVIPALNEADCIGSVVAQANIQDGVDVLVVDDGSSDDTAAVAMLHGATVLHAPLWQGAWGAIQTGVRYAIRHGYDAVVTMDADGQHEPGYLPQLIAAGRTSDVVIASCPSRGSRLRHWAWRYFKFLTGFTLDDLTSGFRFYNMRACRLLASREATLLDYQDVGVLLLLRHANLKISEIPVAMNPRKSGASRVFSSWWTVGRYMVETSLLCLARWNKAPRTPTRNGA